MADYFDAPTDPADHSDGSSSTIRTIWTSLAAAFAKMAGYTGNGGKVVVINAGGTAQEAVSSLTVAQGGSGRATATTAYGLLAAGTTATGAHQTLAAGATTEILVGGGASALPVWTAATGSGAPVRATSPTLVTPDLGTPSAVVLTNATGTAASLTAGLATAASTVTVATDATNASFYLGFVSATTGNLAIKLDGDLTYNPSTNTLTVANLTGTASGNLVSGGALGTPSSGTLTNATGLPAAGVTNTAATLSDAQTFITNAKTFTNSLLKLLGSSTGATTFTSANAGASNYTFTIPAADMTPASIGANTFTGVQLATAQPAFLAVAAGQTNVTGDNTLYTVTFTTEVFDQANNFDGISTFTAPVTGRYRFDACVGYAGVTAGMGNTDTAIVTSNRTYYVHYQAAAIGTGGDFDVRGSVLCDMDAGDTAVVKAHIGGGALVVDLGVTETTFSGNLVC